MAEGRDYYRCWNCQYFSQTGISVLITLNTFAVVNFCISGSEGQSWHAVVTRIDRGELCRGLGRLCLFRVLTMREVSKSWFASCLAFLQYGVKIWLITSFKDTSFIEILPDRLQSTRGQTFGASLVCCARNVSFFTDFMQFERFV